MAHAASWQFKLGEKIGDFGFVCPMVGGSSLKMTTSGSAEALLVMPQRRFPPPWRAEEHDACFIVKDRARAEPGLCVFREPTRLPLGIKAAEGDFRIYSMDDEAVYGPRARIPYRLGVQHKRAS